jgi:hypothetical protein
MAGVPVPALFDAAADPADEAGAERIALAAGFESVRVTTTPPPRRSSLVFADAAA